MSELGFTAGSRAANLFFSLWDMPTAPDIGPSPGRSDLSRSLWNCVGASLLLNPLGKLLSPEWQPAHYSGSLRFKCCSPLLISCGAFWSTSSGHFFSRRRLPVLSLTEITRARCSSPTENWFLSTCAHQLLGGVFLHRLIKLYMEDPPRAHRTPGDGSSFWDVIIPCAVLRTTDFCITKRLCLSGICLMTSDVRFDINPVGPITTGFMVVFIPQSLEFLSVNPYILDVSRLPFVRCCGHVYQGASFLLNFEYIRLICVGSSVCAGISQISVVSALSTIGSGLCSYHLFVTGILNSWHMFQCRCEATRLCPSKPSLPK